MIHAQVIVRPRPSIFDPQGDAVKRAVLSQGLSGVAQVHVGKCIELELNGTDPETARQQLDSICSDLLSNPVIEDYELKVTQPGLKVPSDSSPEKKSKGVLPKKSAKSSKVKVKVKVKPSVSKFSPVKLVKKSMTKKTAAPAKSKTTPAKAVKSAAPVKSKTVKSAKPAAAVKKAAAPAKKAAAKAPGKAVAAKKAAPVKKVAAKAAPKTVAKKAPAAKKKA